MNKPVGYEHMNPVQLALFCARLQLAFLQGATVLDTSKSQYVHTVDNLEVIHMIDAANAWMDSPDGKDTLSSSAPQNSHP